MSNQQQEIARLVEETDVRMDIPSDPNDKSVPVVFGECGFISYTDEGVVLLSHGSDLEELMTDPFLSVASELFGNIMFVTYGFMGKMLDDTDEVDEDFEMFPTRVIVGVTREGFCASAIRRLDTNEYTLDSEGIVSGGMKDELVRIARGER